MDKTFDAIQELKNIELELHRLKNALEMAKRANEPKKEWKGLSDKEKLYFINYANSWTTYDLIRVVEEELRMKNNG